MRHFLLALADQILHRWRALIGVVSLIVTQALVHLGDACWEVNPLKLLHHDLDFLLAVVPDLLDFTFLGFTPIPTFASLVLLEVVVELAEEVLVGALSENNLEFADAVLVSCFFALAQELKDFFPGHAKSTLQNIVQVFVKSLDLFDVGVLECHSQVVLHVVHGVVEHLFNFVFVGLRCSP